MKLKKTSKIKLLVLITIVLVVLDLFVPIQMKTTTICTHSRRNLITGPLTEKDRGPIEPGIVAGICSESKYGIYFL